MSDEQTPVNTQLFELRMEASGSVYDKDGNLLNQDVKATRTVTLTAAEAQAFMEGQAP
jgi:hypothetical protein